MAVATSIHKSMTFAVAPPNGGVYVRSAGHYHLPSGGIENRDAADFGELFWGIAGEGYFRHPDGREQRLTGRMCWHYPPGVPHAIRAGDAGFHYRWVTLAGEHGEDFFTGLGIAPGAAAAGSCPEELFSEIELLLPEKDRGQQLAALAIALRILTLAVTPPGKTRPGGSAARAAALIEENYPHAALNVEAVAEKLQLHRVALSRSFRQAYGVSISAYLAGCRLREALRLLHRPEPPPIAEIARRCGYATPGYFAKAFRRATGKRPSEFLPPAGKNRNCD